MFCTPEPPNCAQRIEKTHLSEGELTIMPPLEVEREKKHISLKILHGNIQWNEAYWSGRRKGSNTYPQSYMLYNVLKK